jgi:NAD(P)-dependent dehydrogenase (short-subunit alcohol dehydrogenase family)
MSVQDAAIPEDNVRVIKETVDKLGGLDVIVANAGWTRFSPFGDINALPLEDWNKVLYCLPPKEVSLTEETSVGPSTS